MSDASAAGTASAMSSRTCNNFLAMTWRQANGHSTVISPNKRYTSLTIVSNGNATAMQRNATQCNTTQKKRMEGMCVMRTAAVWSIGRHSSARKAAPHRQVGARKRHSQQ